MAAVYKFAVRTGEAGHKTAQRGLCYASCIVLVQLPYAATSIAHVAFGTRSFRSLAVTTFALGGFLSMLVFLMYRRKMKTAYGRLIRKIVDCFSCNSKPMEEEEPVAVGRDLFLTTTDELE